MSDTARDVASRCVIVGASHAGAQVAVSLRQRGWSGSITLIGAEDQLPYHRPPLSKAVLAGEKSRDEILLRPAAAYAKAEVDIISGRRATRILREQKSLELDNGERQDYDRLVLCTGAEVRRLPVPGADLPGVFYLRTIHDVEGIHASLDVRRPVVIIGGGYIGLEVAAQLRRRGLEVTIVETMERVLQRVTTEAMSAFYTRIHREEGVEVRTGCAVRSVAGTDRVEGVILDDGSTLAAGMVIVGIGVLPAVALAEASGLTVDNGIVVNEFGQTSDDAIFAAGDCTRHYNPIYQRWLRLESVQNALDQGAAVARAISGDPQTYSALPWFWSDQFDVQLKIAGLSDGYDKAVVRGDTEQGRSFAVFYFRGNALLAVDAVNRPKEFMVAKKLLAAGRSLDAAAAADESIPPADFL